MVAVIVVEPLMTWLLVSTSPSALITMPVPAAASLAYCSVVLMITRPGLTLVTMACSPPLSGADRAPGAGHRAATWQGNARAAGRRVVEGQEQACREGSPHHRHEGVRQHAAASAAPGGWPVCGVFQHVTSPPDEPPAGKAAQALRT